jgi:hypothetical protein
LVIDAAKVAGVKMADGKTLTAPVVLSNAAPLTTFTVCALLRVYLSLAQLLVLQKLLPSGSLPADFKRHVTGLNTASGVVKINLALSALPSFKCKPTSGERTGCVVERSI